MTTILSLRLSLKAGGYAPIPVNGKRPPMTGWSKLGTADAQTIRTWEKSYPHAASTGILTALVPVLDIDITRQPAAEAVEALVRERFEEAGFFLVRIGKPPKRAIPFRCDQPFKKISVELISPEGSSGQKIEFLGDGQQVVCFGDHQETRKPYYWHGGEPGKIKREDLPYIHEEQARQLVRDAVDLLCRDFGYQRAAARSRSEGNGAAGAADWAALVEAIKKGHGLHDSLRDLAGKLVASGMDIGAAINFLRGLMDQAEGEHDARWKARRDDIPRLVESAAEPPKATPLPVEPKPLAEVHEVFLHWLGEDYDLDTLDTMLAVCASEKLPGDPCWLMVVSGPGNAKTETVQASSGIGAHVISTITSDAALLSASPRKQRTKDATGGLLRKIGDRGILCVKDFTSILSSSREVRSSVLAALREIHDGRWVRNVGSDGGHTLTWTGRLVVVAACTTALDQAHSVIATMGDRFVLVRSDSSKGRVKSGQRAMRNTGSEPQMREELAQAVAGAIASVDPENLYQLSETDCDTILQAADLVTLARTGVELDYRGDVIDAHAPEMPTRFAKQLTQVMRGAVAVGMGQRQALRLAIRVARDSMPQLRLAVLRDVAASPNARVQEIRRRLQKPRATVDRTLQALHTLGLLVCEESEQERGDKTVSVWRYTLASHVNLAVLAEPAEVLL